MKTPKQLKEAAMSRSIQLDPNSQAAQEMMRRQQEQAMAARLVIEIASSIYVRRVSDLGHAAQSEAILADVAREAFKAAQSFLVTANEPAPTAAPADDKQLVLNIDGNGSPV